MKALLINGPNLNMLGQREESVYGSTTLNEIEKSCVQHAKSLNIALDCYQSNHEGDIIETIHQAKENYEAILINAGAFTHTSVAIHDALRIFEGKIVEIHMSNTYARESFRHKSFISPVATGILCGFGERTYLLALDALCEERK